MARSGAAARAAQAAAGLLLAAWLVALAGCATAQTFAAHGGAGSDSPVFSERQVMVTLAPGPPPLLAERTRGLSADYRLRMVLSWPIASLGEPCVVFEVAGDRSPAEVARRMASDPRVRSAQPIQLFEALAAPAAPEGGDPYAHLQYGAQALRLAAAHRRATGKGVRVAVIDTGVDLDHPDLRGRIAKASSFVDRGEQTFTTDIHGTAMAGVLAAAAGNDVGIMGVAPEAEIFAFKACWPRSPGTRQALCNSYTLIKALDAAIAERAQVVNLSLAGPADPLLARLVGLALKRGIVVVGARAPAEGAGGKPGFPADVEGVIAVAASDPDGSLRGAARTAGGRPVLAAPGVDILSTAPRGAYDFFTGSSLAAAAVSGVAALLLEANPRLAPAQVRTLLEKSARPLPAALGAGTPPVPLVDACAAVALVTGGGGCDEDPVARAPAQR